MVSDTMYKKTNTEQETSFRQGSEMASMAETKGKK